MIYDILEARIVGSSDLVVGVSLFRNFMPAECLIGAFFRNPLSGIAIDPHMPNWYKTKLQLITRHTDPIEGNRLANHLAQILTIKSPESHPANAERGRAHISIFYPVSLPIQFPKLVGNGLEWSQHFTAAFGFDPL